MSLGEASAELLSGIVAATADIALVTTDRLVIRSAVAGTQLARAAQIATWRDKPLDSVLSPDSWLKLQGRLAALKPGDSAPLQVELTHQAGPDDSFPIRYAVTGLGQGGGYLMVGRDMTPMAEIQQQLVKAQLALERDYEAMREMETRYRVLLEANPAPLLIVSITTGRIVDLNAAATELIGAPRAELVDAALAQEFDGRRRGELLEGLGKLAGADGEDGMDLTVKRNRKKVTATATAFRAAGDRLLLCRLRASDSARAHGNDVVDMAERLFHKGIDAVVFLDMDGKVKAANEAFLNLTDTGSQAMVQGRSFADFLSRGAIDLKVLIDNVRRIGHLRHYATRLNTDFSGQVSVEMSATLFQDRAHPAIALMIRDSNLADATRILPSPVGNDGLRNVMQMLGYATLRDIVSETTEIIEKMCIETALELTGNNRVAAAELLSLSRQSLYVKLRKFGLLSKDNA